MEIADKDRSETICCGLQYQQETANTELKYFVNHVNRVL